MTIPNQEQGSAGASPEWITARAPSAAEVVQRLQSFPWLLSAHRDLVLSSVKRELAARFTGTLLGWLWPLVQPVLMFAVYYFIFTKLLAMKLPPEAMVPGQEAFLGVYMFGGVLVWGGFADGLLRSTSVIVDNGNLIKKLAFPSEILPLNAALTSMVTMLFGLVVFLLGCWFTPVWSAPDPVLLLWLPLLIVLQTLFVTGLGLLFSTLHVFLRDTAQILGLVVTVWMFVTPIFWLPQLPGIRESVAPYLGLIEGNPMFHFLYAWRAVLMSGVSPEAATSAQNIHSVAFAAPIGPAVLLAALWAVGAFVAGYTVFILGQRRFADEV